MIRNRSEDIAHCDHPDCPKASTCYRHLTREEHRKLAKERGLRWLTYCSGFNPSISDQCFMP